MEVAANSVASPAATTASPAASKAWQLELLMEKMRSKANQYRPLVESAKTLRMTMMEKRFPLDSQEKAQLQKCLDTLQHSIKVTSLQSVVERLESVARQLGLKFRAGPSGTDYFISSDMFYLEVAVEANGQVKDVKIQHEGKSEQQSCPELVTCLCKGDFVDFTAHLEGLASIYQLTGDRKVKAKAFVSLQSLERDLEELAQVQSFINEPHNLVHKSPVGVLQPRRGGHPTKLTYFISPYDLLDVRSRTSLPLTVETIVERGLGCSALVCIEGSSPHRLQVTSLISISRSADGKRSPSFSALSPLNSTMLPACYVLKLTQPVPICNTLTAKLSQITQIEHANNGCESTESSPMLGLIARNASQGQLDCGNNRGLFVTLPDQQHCYFVTENPGMEGSVVKSIPFTHPTHVPQILNVLRQQTLFNVLVSSCIRPASKPDLEKAIVFEISSLSWQNLSVSFEHPLEETMATAEFNLSDISNVRCKIHTSATDIVPHLFNMEEYASKVVQRCLSIPVTMRALLKRWQSQSASVSPPATEISLSVTSNTSAAPSMNAAIHGSQVSAGSATQSNGGHVMVSHLQQAKQLGIATGVKFLPDFISSKVEDVPVSPVTTSLPLAPPLPQPVQSPDLLLAPFMSSFVPPLQPNTSSSASPTASRGPQPPMMLGMLDSQGVSKPKKQRKRRQPSTPDGFGSSHVSAAKKRATQDDDDGEESMDVDNDVVGQDNSTLDPDGEQGCSATGFGDSNHPLTPATEESMLKSDPDPIPTPKWALEMAATGIGPRSNSPSPLVGTPTSEVKNEPADVDEVAESFGLATGLSLSKVKSGKSGSSSQGASGNSSSGMRSRTPSLKNEGRSKSVELALVGNPGSTDDCGKASIVPSVSITPVTAAACSASLTGTTSGGVPIGAPMGSTISSMLASMGLEGRRGIEIIPIGSSTPAPLPSSITITPIGGAGSTTSSSGSNKDSSSSSSTLGKGSKPRPPRTAEEEQRRRLEKKKRRQQQQESEAVSKATKMVSSSTSSSSSGGTGSGSGSSSSSSNFKPVSSMANLLKKPGTPPTSLQSSKSKSASSSPTPSSGSKSSKPSHSPSHSKSSGSTSPKLSDVLGSSLSSSQQQLQPRGNSGSSSNKPLKDKKLSPGSNSPSQSSKSSKISSKPKLGSLSASLDHPIHSDASAVVGGTSPVTLSGSSTSPKLSSSSSKSSGGSLSVSSSSLLSGGLGKKGGINAVIDKLNAKAAGSSVPRSSSSGSIPTSKAAVAGGPGTGSAGVAGGLLGSEYMVKAAGEGLKLTINKTSKHGKSSGSGIRSSSGAKSASLSGSSTGLKPGVSSGPASRKTLQQQHKSSTSSSVASLAPRSLHPKDVLNILSPGVLKSGQRSTNTTSSSKYSSSSGGSRMPSKSDRPRTKTSSSGTSGSSGKARSPSLAVEKARIEQEMDRNLRLLYSTNKGTLLDTVGVTGASAISAAGLSALQLPSLGFDPKFQIPKLSRSNSSERTSTPSSNTTASSNVVDHIETSSEDKQCESKEVVASVAEDTPTDLSMRPARSSKESTEVPASPDRLIVDFPGSSSKSFGQGTSSVPLLPPPPPPPPPPRSQTPTTSVSPAHTPPPTATNPPSSPPSSPSTSPIPSPSVSVHIVHSPAVVVAASPAAAAVALRSPSLTGPSPQPSPCVIDDELMDEALVGLGK